MPRQAGDDPQRRERDEAGDVAMRVIGRIREFLALIAIASITSGCADPPPTLSPLGDDWSPQCAIDRPLITYQHVGGSGGDPAVPGLYVRTLDSTSVSRLL